MCNYMADMCILRILNTHRSRGITLPGMWDRRDYRGQLVPYSRCRCTLRGYSRVRHIRHRQGILRRYSRVCRPENHYSSDIFRILRTRRSPGI